MKKSTPGIGLIGYGRFGKFAAKHLVRYGRMLIYDPRRLRHESLPRGARVGSLVEVAKQPVVILAVPVFNLRKTLQKISPHVVPGALIVDVSAVKGKPVIWMKQILPRSVNILGTHPLFGPDSAASDITGHSVVLCPVRIPYSLMKEIGGILSRAGLKTLRMSPSNHDKMIAETLFVTQMVGRIVAGAKLSRHACSTPNYEKLISLQEVAERDTERLFLDLWEYNPAARKVSNGLWKAHLTIRNKESGKARERH